jgi:hypothetical protein
MRRSSSGIAPIAKALLFLARFISSGSGGAVYVWMFRVGLTQHSGPLDARRAGCVRLSCPPAAIMPPQRAKSQMLGKERGFAG